MLSANATFTVSTPTATFETTSAAASFATQGAAAALSVGSAVAASMGVTAASMASSIGTVIYSGEIPSNYGLITYNGSYLTIS